MEDSQIPKIRNPVYPTDRSLSILPKERLEEEYDEGSKKELIRPFLRLVSKIREMAEELEDSKDLGNSTAKVFEEAPEDSLKK